jgi:hypothetical protein
MIDRWCTPQRFKAFMAMCAIEPKLAMLAVRTTQIAHETYRDRSFCANTHWHGLVGQPSLKAEMRSLVGHFAAQPELRTSQHYDVACEYLYGLLPDCRQCGCKKIIEALGL